MLNRNDQSIFAARIKVENSQENSSKLKLWLKRIGIAGFLFFLLKGLAWLAVIWLGIDVLGGC